ncbi:hypothetical protein HF1_13470 [Mycoplasma haemofelis str. Langford 1]|uniref:Uncharacterized protein n=1 Tax=Mycoplasma haemofelis (strain Langford 1) TaxID=941640 RepID=E8ZJN4_MYCHL|nr:hypothetical protein [Mycoplasma haemofelis]CBY93355.1 hypothetical protein HF1_13470 [Mycoplasma haemofelis str. Langford 1]
MKSLTLGLSGAAAAGTGATGYYIYQRSSSETIQDKLSSLKLISSVSTNKEEVDKQWKEEFTIDKDAIKRVITNIKDDSKGGEALSKWCQDNLTKPVSEPLLTNVKKWCFIGTIESKIKRNKTFIELGSTQEWEGIWNKHTETEKRSKVGLTEAQGSNTKDKDLKAIQDFCSENRKKDFLAKEKVTVYDEVVDWCTK